MNFKFKHQDYKVEIWNGEKLGNLVCLDTETTIAPFHMTPELVTIQAYGGNDIVYYIREEDFERFYKLHDKTKYIMHNAPFDIGVLSKSFPWFEFSTLYDAERIYDTSVLY